MISRKIEIPGVFNLEDAISWEAARVERAGPALSITTPATAWGYAAALPCRRISESEGQAGDYLIEIESTIISGRIGFGCAGRDPDTPLIQSIHQEEGGTSTIIFRLDSLDDCGGLLVRNGDRAQPSQVIIRSIRVFRALDDGENPPFIFEHIFKTAGTTFHHSYLAAAFRPEQRMVLRGTTTENAVDRQRLQVLPDDKRRQLRVIAGHKAIRLRDSFPYARFLTLVREPVARVVSAYLHAVHRVPNPDVLDGHVQVEGIGIREFVSGDLFARGHEPNVSVHNWQARTLLGDLLDSGLGDERLIERIIRERFFLIGCTETLELFLFYLHWTAGFPLALFNNRLVRGSQGFQLRPEDIATIRRFNEMDEIVYRVARREFERRVDAIWTAEVELDYRCYLAKLRRFREATGGDYNRMRLFRVDPPVRQRESMSVALRQEV